MIASAIIRISFIIGMINILCLILFYYMEFNHFSYDNRVLCEICFLW